MFYRKIKHFTLTIYTGVLASASELNYSSYMNVEITDDNSLDNTLNNHNNGPENPNQPQSGGGDEGENKAEFTETLEINYRDFSLSVIKRTIPDACDGLKPVQRRILYSMFEGGYLWDRPYKKSAKIVGDVLGKYHPHGDSSIYDALVRMAQDFSMSISLVDGQGNFGSVDGDSAASMRYTESRLMKVSKYLLQDVDKDCVNYGPNYDDSLEQPKVLPAQFPNLLVNGTSGIAVGMATSIPTHNLNEVIDATCAYIDNPRITVEELMHYIKGPDFPTGGIVSDKRAILQMYREGRGSVTLKGLAHIEESNNSIVITEIPYQVNKSRLIEHIVDNLTELPEFDEITNVRDESSAAEGVRIVIELKRNANAEIVCRNLFEKSQLKIAVHAHMLALDNGVPKQLTLLDLLRIFVEFRDQTVIRRTLFYMKNAQTRAHTLIGFILAMDKLSDIISTVRASSSTEEAKEALMKLTWRDNEVEIPNYPYQEISLSESQVKSILEMRLQSLTRMEQNKIKGELEEVLAKIKELESLLNNQNNRLEMIKSEMQQVKSEFKTPRKTSVEEFSSDSDEMSLVPNEECVITISHRGYLKRVSLETYRNQRRGGRGKQGTQESDPTQHLLVGNTHQEIYLFSSSGYVYSMFVYKIPEAAPNTLGRAMVNLIEVDKDEKIAAVLAMNSTDENMTLMFVTSKGYVRRNSIKDFTNIRKNGKIAIKLEEGEHLAAVVMAKEGDELMVTSSGGKSVRMPITEVRVFNSRTSRGVIGMNLGAGETVVSVALISDQNRDANACIFTVTERGFGKRAKLEDYRSTGRGAKGVTTTIVNNKTGTVIGAYEVEDEDELLLMNSKGQIIRCSVSSVRVTGRRAEGVHLAKLDAEDKIVHMFIIKNSGDTAETKEVAA